jgi:hypothetical protein
MEPPNAQAERLHEIDMQGVAEVDGANRLRFRVNHIGQINPASVQVRTGNGHSVFSIGSMIIQGKPYHYPRCLSSSYL